MQSLYICPGSQVLLCNPEHPSGYMMPDPDVTVISTLLQWHGDGAARHVQHEPINAQLHMGRGSPKLLGSHLKWAVGEATSRSLLGLQALSLYLSRCSAEVALWSWRLALAILPFSLMSSVSGEMTAYRRGPGAGPLTAQGTTRLHQSCAGWGRAFQSSGLTRAPQKCCALYCVPVLKSIFGNFCMGWVIIESSPV